MRMAALSSGLGLRWFLTMGRAFMRAGRCAGMDMATRRERLRRVPPCADMPTAMPDADLWAPDMVTHRVGRWSPREVEWHLAAEHVFGNASYLKQHGP